MARHHATRMRGLALALTVCAAARPAAVRGQPGALLMPTPAAARWENGAPSVFGRVAVSLPTHAGPVLRGAAARLTQRLTALRATARGTASSRPALTVTVRCTCAPGSGLALHDDERSTLRLSATGAEVEATTEVGVLRAFATLTQLAQSSNGGVALPRGEVTDAPRYAWRGLMVDVSRHFQSVAALRRQIDAMELVKLNVLHLHLSDNEGFRVESRRYPRLQAAASGGEYYTQAQLRALVAYAAERGVRVVPEIDLPGHSRALTTAYPMLSSDTSGARTAEIDPTREEVLAFVDTLLTEVAGLFPDRYFHIGADEVNAQQWNGNPRIRRYMADHALPDAHALQATFTARVHGTLQRLGKVTIGWDEVLSPDLPASVVIQSWRSATMTVRAAQQGHPVIVSAGYYLDWLTASDSLHRIDPADPMGMGLTPEDRALLRGHRLERFVPVEFVRDPAARMTEGDARRILGGEAPMWTELVTEEKLDATVWPRMAAVADRLWAPPAATTAPLDERLDAVAQRLTLLGMQHVRGPREMRRRLAPTGGAPLEALASALEPVKFYAHNHRARGPASPVQQFTALADALPPESLTAARFTRLARGWDPDARETGAWLRATLTQWRDQAARMAPLMARHPALRDAQEASRDLSTLARAALEAMAHRERGTRPDAAWLAALQPTLDRQRGYAQASRNFVQSVLAPQPPGDLLLAPLDGLETLIRAVHGTR